MSKHNQQNRRSKLKNIAASIRGVDLFCGAGGLTHGLEVAGINVRLGIDTNPACKYPYTENNKASFLLMPIEEATSTDFAEAFGKDSFRLLAGCAPCQPFSTYSKKWSCPSDERWNLLAHFSRLVRESEPHLVTMENVPPLEREDVFADFVTILKDEGFNISHGVVNCADYGVPQQRQRLVLIASTLGPIQLIDATTPAECHQTVRKAIGDMPPLEAGEAYEGDPLHRACGLSPLNLKRIRKSKPGGTWSDWDKSLRASCHRKASGKSYRSVYGRMTWDAPSPTMTTQYYGFGNGRFGHPEQDRAISLREGAILQSFPKTYKFVPEGRPVNRGAISQLIGNAVPVKLGAAIGESIVLHVERWLDSQELAT